MKILRLLLIMAFGGMLFLILQLPDQAGGNAALEYAELPPADFRRLAGAEWQAGRAGQAILLLNYAVENNLPDAAACDGAREGYMAAMAGDQTPAGQLARLGLEQTMPGAGGFASLSGGTVADWFLAGGARAEGDDEISRQVAAAQKLTALFPPAAPALRLVESAWRGGILHGALQQQLARALEGMASAPEGAPAAAAAQESIMPLLQLARQCRTWAEFTVLAQYARSIDQVKLLARMASLATLNAVKLARPLIMARAEQRPDLAPAIMDYIVRRGQAGIDAMDHVLRRGSAGLELLLRHPDIPASMLEEARTPAWPPSSWRTAWKNWSARSGRLAAAVQSAAVVLLCMGILVCLLPWRILRGAAAAPGGARFYLWYWMAVAGIGAAVGALLMLHGTPAPADAGSAAVTGAAGIGGDAAIQAYGPRQMVSWLVILIAILLLQGTCWEVARRKIQAVEEDAQADAAGKLRQLDNLDIFFDLPLYAGLALTILAFILISALGAGVSRFLAYASTFVGILFAVALRLGHLYPLREKLIKQTGK